MTRANGNGRKNGKRPANNGPRPRIDWGIAFAYYVGLGPTRTYAAVASEFGVSEAAVRKHAKPEEWEIKAVAIDAKAADRAEQRVVRSLEERNVRTLRLIEQIRDFALTLEAEQLDPVVVLRSLPRYLRHEQLLAGEATERTHIALADHQRIEEGWQDTMLWLLTESEAGRTPSPEALLERLQRATVGALEQGNGAGA